MSLDYSEFQDYCDRFREMSSDFDTWLNSFILNEGLRFIQKVKPRTPVDTGNLRGAWGIGAVTWTADSVEVEIFNPMSYASFVEYGHAKPYCSGAGPGSPLWVEGYFMMTVTLDEIYRNMPRRFNKQFTEFLKDRGVM